MGNVPVSCCKSKSPRLKDSDSNQANKVNHGSKRGYKQNKSSAHRAEAHDKESQSSHILQHISEREPDDSETDPSSNPLDRPIFASRISNYRNIISTAVCKISGISTDDQQHINDGLSNSPNPTREQTSSQDHSHQSNINTNPNQQLDDESNNSFKNNSNISQPQATGSNINSKVNEIFQAKCHKNYATNIISPCPDLSGNSEDEFEDSTTGQPAILKTSSCSRIYNDGSTISQPDLKQTIMCVSLAIYYHIRNRSSNYSIDIFDETIHPLKLPDLRNLDTDSHDRGEQLIILTRDSLNDQGEPDQETIYSFVKTVFQGAQLTSEYAITTLVYLERLMTYAEIDLTPKTWRRMFLGAILLSSKVWEDQAVWNVDYAQILEEISVEDINDLERNFLGLIQFNMNVPSSVYAKYYYHLRSLALTNRMSKGHSLMTVSEAKTLEVSFL